MAMHDTGCTNTMIKTSALLKLQDHDYIKLIQPKHEINIISCTGEHTSIRGFAELLLQFKGDNGIKITIPHLVMVHDEIDFDFILGLDLSGSDYKAFETNNHLYLTTNSRKVTSLKDCESYRDELCNVPLVRTTSMLYSINVTQEVIIPPFTLVNIPCGIDQTTNAHVPIKLGDGSVFYELINVAQKNLKTLPALLSFEDTDHLWIPIYNDTNDEYQLSNKTYIGHIQLLDSDIPIMPVSMKIMSEDEHAYRCNHMRPAFIEKDDTLNEEEKTAAFLEFAATGKFHPSMSHLIEESPTLTEMELKNIQPFNEKDFPKQFKLDHLKNHDKRAALRMLMAHKDAFSKHDLDLGCANNIEMDIQVMIDDHKPKIQKYFAIPHAAREQTAQILEQMKAMNVIRDCNEPSLFCSNLLVVAKKDKSQLRLLLDGRLINSSTIRLPTSVVHSQEVIIHAVEKDHMTVMDVSHAFYQIPLSKDAQPITSFFSHEHGKRMCFQRAPQGLKNSPLYLKLMMDKMFGDMVDTVIHYADDVLVATKGTLEEHFKIVGEVLQRFIKANVKIQPRKLNIAQEEIEFLGVIWKKGKLNVPEARLLAFKNYPVPRTPKQAKAFVCAMSYYRKFIPYFAELSKSIMDLSTLHPKLFKWTPDHQAAFERMINELIKHSSLYLPDPKLPFYVQTDASDVAGAGRVYQLDPEGNELLISCVSRTFTAAERKYGAFRKEVLALVYTLRTMDFFLRFAPKLKILVDAKAILNLRLCKDSAGILLRFSLEISKYEAELHHVPGVDNKISDILSRHSSGIQEILDKKRNKNVLTEAESERILQRLIIPKGRIFTKEEVLYMLDAPSLESPFPKAKRKSTAKAGKRVLTNLPKILHERKIKMPAQSFRRPGVKLPRCNCATARNYGIRCNHAMIHYNELNSVAKVMTKGLITPKQFIEAQDADERISNLKSRKKLPSTFLIQDGLLFYKNLRDKSLKPALPTALLDPLINAKHFTVFGMHNSKTRIIRDIRKKYYVHMRVLTEKLNELTSSCLICQYNTNNVANQAFQMSNFRQAPRVCWAVDLIPNLPKTSKNHNAMLIAVDVFTGYVQLYPMKSRSTTEIIEAIQKAIISPFGIPKILRCDNETGMENSKEFTKFLDSLKIKFMPCSHAAAWGNGRAEKGVGIIKEAARKFVMQEHENDNWDEYVHFFSLAHNQSTSIYGYAPEELHFGYKMPNEIDLLQFWPDCDNQEDYMQQILPQAIRNRSKALATSIFENNRVLTHRNKNRTSKDFRVGEVVLHKSLQLSTGTGGAMKPKMLGPFSIVAIEKNGSSALIENMQTKKVTKAHFTNLQLLNFNPRFNRLPHNFDNQMLKFLPQKYSKDKYYSQSSSSQATPLSSQSQEFNNNSSPEYNSPPQRDSQEFRGQRINDNDIDRCPSCLVKERLCTCVEGFRRRDQTNTHTPRDYTSSDHLFFENEDNLDSQPLYLDEIFSQESEAYDPKKWHFDNQFSQDKREKSQKSILKVKTDNICSQIAKEQIDYQPPDTDTEDDNEQLSEVSFNFETNDFDFDISPNQNRNDYSHHTEDYENLDFDIEAPDLNTNENIEINLTNFLNNESSQNNNQNDNQNDYIEDNYHNIDVDVDNDRHNNLRNESFSNNHNIRKSSRIKARIDNLRERGEPTDSLTLARNRKRFQDEFE